MTLVLSGATRVIAIAGDPIAQVKSPAGVTQALVERGRNAVVVPMHVAADAFDAFMRGLGMAHNVDGIIATIPHKFAAYRHCSTASERARILGAANVLRRNADGTWHGDMLDGSGFVAALHKAGGVTQGRRALLAGAGGAGSAIGLALIQAGVAELAIHDPDTQRQSALLQRLAGVPGAKVRGGSADPAGFDIIVNASPVGMRAADSYPVEPAGLVPTTFVGDVITAPEVTPLLAAARRIGCVTATGVDMFRQVQELMVDFLLASGPLAEASSAGN